MTMLWTDEFKPARHVLLDADSWEAWLAEVCPRLEDLPGRGKRLSARGLPLRSLRKEGLKVGDNFYGLVDFPATRMADRYEGCGLPAVLFTGPMVERQNSLPLLAGSKGCVGYVRFDRDTVIPVLTGPVGESPWMSLTPSETYTLRGGIRKARGKVLIGGLGMGWMAHKVLARKGVKSVTVVEKDPAIAKFFGKGLDVVVGDLWEYLEAHPASRFDTVLVDIWKGFGNADSDKKFWALSFTHPRVWGWGFYPEAWERRWRREQWEEQRGERKTAKAAS
jgi:hypothetical protein